MLKIQKSRVTKYAEVPYQARHTGKSGYVYTKPAPKPYPFGIAEEIGASAYPHFRDYIPKDFRSYSDSYIDLRNRPYKEWYDKWGRPTIDRYSSWHKKGYAEIRQTLQNSLQKKTGKTYNSYSRRNGKQSSSKYSNAFLCTCMRKHRWVKPLRQPNRRRPTTRRSTGKARRYYGRNTFYRKSRY